LTDKYPAIAKSIGGFFQEEFGHQKPESMNFPVLWRKRHCANRATALQKSHIERRLVR
jgi:hypothetical protein